ncbi:carbonate dehydratase [Paenibacillus chartarius]|uniref:Carbonate dehydratase n=1 Tax=Paenibacillus chartarius TaxID=747481 RepID=A0ABV6DLS2_9BACL
MSIHQRIPSNCFVHFMDSAPSTSFNSSPVAPQIDETAFVGPFSSVIGDVRIERNVFIAPNVSVRADEGSPFHIGEGTNLQDGVIVHGLKQGRVKVNGRDYSVYVDRSVSVAHGAVVHGPVYIGEGTFVGFKAIVLQAIIGRGVYISHNAIVTGNVSIAPERFVPPGAIIDTQEKANLLSSRPKDKEEFAKEVQRVNREFAASYSLMFGKERCSCGMACDW